MKVGEQPADSAQATPQGEMDALLLGRLKELPVVDIDSSNWKGITIAVFVIFLICSVIASSIVLINPGIHSKFVRKADKEKITLDQVLSGAFSAASFNGTWLSDNELLYRNSDGDLVLFNIDTNTVDSLVPNSILNRYIVQRYTLSPDRRYLLLVYDIKRIFRHSFVAKHAVYTIDSEAVSYLTPPNTSGEIDLQYASWGPKPNSSQLAFVYRNNIFYKDSANSNEVTQLTNSEDVDIFNGVPDWVYEEEILSTANAYWWSPDGSKLCYAQFDDRLVDIQQYPWYGSNLEASTLYSETIKIRYPKPGRTNPIVVLRVADLSTPASNQSYDVSPPQELNASEYYFTAIAWVGSGTLAITWITRVQTYSVVSLCGTDNRVWICSAIFEQNLNGIGWVDMYESPIYNQYDDHFYLRLPQNNTPSLYRQIARFSRLNSEPIFLTDGEYDTTQILSIRREASTGTDYLYYVATAGKAEERHVYKIRLDYTNVKTTAECLTCDWGSDCLYNNAIFSSDAKYLVLECNGPGIPRAELRVTDTYQINMTLQSNDNLRNTLETKSLPSVQIRTIPINGYNLSAMLYLPPSFQDNIITKYPLLVQVYGGPNSQNVNQRFQINWGTYMASTKNIIFAFIDGRGSGYKGAKLMYELYLKLGTVEIEDQIAIAKYLRDNLDYIDKNAIGIWGWSYGGYATALSLATDINDSVFSCGISVAPVTSWLLYDSVYTERYMSLPKYNMESYLKSDVISKASNFKGKKFLLVHGTADDNVHVQHSMVLMKALANANVMYDTLIYPDDNHALTAVRVHLYQTMEHFWEQCFLLDEYYESIGSRRRKLVKYGQSLI